MTEEEKLVNWLDEIIEHKTQIDEIKNYDNDIYLVPEGKYISVSTRAFLKLVSAIGPHLKDEEREEWTMFSFERKGYEVITYFRKEN